MISSAPTSMKPWLCGGAAASQMLIDGGITFGHRLMPRPL